MASQSNTSLDARGLTYYVLNAGENLSIKITQQGFFQGHAIL